jgi:glycolate oxidase FAD binding subunit
MEQALRQFRERIAAAAATGVPLRIVGSGSKDWYGNALRGEAFDTRPYAGIVSYDPTELVITARCGTPLAEIEAALSERGQMLAFEPPHFGAGATIGGVVASGLSGPRRAGAGACAGAVRDFMLGAAMMDGKGEVLHFGGQVMKNVAGYDVSRLLAGSMGILGLLLEVSIKVLPQAVAETSLRFELGEADALRTLNAWGRQPLPISASVWQDGQLYVRLSGAAAAVQAARKMMGGENIGAAPDMWRDLREQRSSYFSSIAGAEAILWRISLPASAAPLAVGGAQLIEWGGAQRWLKTDTDAGAARIRTLAAQAGGHATLFRGGDKQENVFQPLAPAVAVLHRNLKTAFDPAGIFNPGRLVPGL